MVLNYVKVLNCTHEIPLIVVKQSYFLFFWGGGSTRYFDAAKRKCITLQHELGVHN